MTWEHFENIVQESGKSIQEALAILDALHYAFFLPLHLVPLFPPRCVKIINVSDDGNLEAHINALSSQRNTEALFRPYRDTLAVLDMTAFQPVEGLVPMLTHFIQECRGLDGFFVRGGPLQKRTLTL